ncbi:hypothetical protein SAMD00079811_48140 [Scytonema sp. HK-05]|nr:hypothetical protein SAMD00079811_48140 [Scytonema sp. HK-05]
MSNKCQIKLRSSNPDYQQKAHSVNFPLHLYFLVYSLLIQRIAADFFS